MNKVRLGVIGYGNMGTSHCKQVQGGQVPRMELTAICDISKARREVAEKNHEGVAIFDNATDLYKSGLCDAVIVATPHYDHPRLVEEAFTYGLNVITDTSKELGKIVDVYPTRCK